MTYALHKQAFLLRLDGNSYQQIGWLMGFSAATARRYVQLDRPADRCTVKAEFN